MKKFIEDHFDKLYLGALFLLLLFFVVRHGDAAITAWGREQASLVLGAIIGLITGVRAGMAIADRKAAAANPEGKQEELLILKTNTPGPSAKGNQPPADQAGGLEP